MQHAILAPLILKFVEIAENTPHDGPAKKAMVIAMAQTALRGLNAKANYNIPKEMLENTEKTAGDLTDVIVAAYNASGIFRMRQRSIVEVERDC
jgi:hypothetical protein